MKSTRSPVPDEGSLVGDDAPAVGSLVGDAIIGSVRKTMMIYLQKTDAEVSRYSIFHYMDWCQINPHSCKAVEIVIMIKAGMFVQNKDPMKMQLQVDEHLSKDRVLLKEIEDSHFKDESVRLDMIDRFKGAQKSCFGMSLIKKLESKMKEVCKFAASIPGFNNPADLPSGMTQLSRMKNPVVMKLWKKKYLVMYLVLYYLYSFFICIS